MIVNRRTFIVEPGKMDQLLALVNAAKEQFGTSAQAWRTYAPEFVEESRTWRCAARPQPATQAQPCPTAPSTNERRR
jgi:hypothetical protein